MTEGSFVLELVATAQTAASSAVKAALVDNEQFKPLATTTVLDMSATLTDQELDDVTRGMMYASLAITDDAENTLTNIAKTNPWHAVALQMITGSELTAHQPLSDILKDCMNLDLDCNINIKRITVGGHFLDTQGYIAHNDEVIVLSYRCTTSAFDWLTNLDATSSAWELEDDLEQGYSGICSGLDDWNICSMAGISGFQKPRVHTGFYNNFLPTTVLIRQYIEPLLKPDQPPRTLYVTGHSLGAGVATLAACYFLFKFDWDALPHTLINVTAGSPRACCHSMKTAVLERLEAIKDPTKVRLYRLVKGRDMVATVPPTAMGFVHLVTAIAIGDDGTILKEEPTPVADAAELHKSFAGKDTINFSLSEVTNEDGEEDHPDDTDDVKELKRMTKYRRLVSRVPRGLRDHMPDFYLRPLFAARGIGRGIEMDHPERMVCNVTNNIQSDIPSDNEAPDSADQGLSSNTEDGSDSKHGSNLKKKRFFLFSRRGQAKVSAAV